DRAQHLARAADVDHEVVLVERGPSELDVDDVRRAVQPLRGAEDLALEAVSDHQMIAYGDGVHPLTPDSRASSVGRTRPSASSRVAQPMTEHSGGPRREPREQRGQLVEAALAADQRIEARVREQLERERHPAPGIPAGTLLRGDAADLRGHEREPPAVEGAAERSVDWTVPVPAQLDDFRLEA